MRERRADRDALLLATRQLGGIGAPSVREADRVEQLARAPVRAGVALEPEAERDRVARS